MRAIFPFKNTSVLSRGANTSFLWRFMTNASIDNTTKRLCKATAGTYRQEQKAAKSEAEGQYMRRYAYKKSFQLEKCLSVSRY